VSSHAHNQALGLLRVQLQKNKFTSKKPLPVLEVAVSKPRAMSYDFRSSQSSSLATQSLVEKMKFYKQRTTASTGSGCEQAQGHEL
jgi:hypothetical protein